MNLLQIQDQLKSLPNDGRIMQMLVSYANGGNPAVPPYLALGELNRRKQMMEQAQAAQASQPPQGTLKDQIAQQAGIMALQQGQQQQGMQQMMESAGQQMGQMGQVPPQVAQQGPVQAARGGLLDLLMAAKARKAQRMNSGGVVAFAGGGDTEDEDEEDDSEDSAGAQFAEGLSLADVAQNQKQALELAARYAANTKSPAESVETPLAFRERMIRENPHKYGHLAKDAEPEIMARLDEFQAAKRAELDKQRQENASLKPGILQLLGRAALNSRGQYGGSALATILGNYEKESSSEAAKGVQQEQALRAKDLEMQQVKMETINKLQELKRARDEGDLAKEQKAKLELAKIAQQHNTSVAGLIKGVVTSTGSTAGKVAAAEIAAKAKVDAVKAKGAATPKETDQSRGIEILAQDIRAKNPDMPETQVRAEALRQYRLTNPAGAGVVQRTTSDAVKELGKFKLLNSKSWKKYVADLGGDEAAASRSWIEDYKAGVLPPQLMGQTPGAAGASPAAPPAPTPASTSGSATVTVNGKTYTFPNQEAADKFKAAAGVK